MRRQKRPQDDFLDKHTHDMLIRFFLFFFGVAESISAMFKWFREMVAAQSCVKAAKTV